MSSNGCDSRIIFWLLIMDFFIIGYPKAGTTSLYDYLKNHPRIFLPDLKEPHFFTEDFPGAREVTTVDAYQSLYSHAASSQLRGDASASVIHSEVALRRILACYPKAKFILLLREPVSAVRSFHGELLHNLNEQERDLESAWRLQTVRQKGRQIPQACKEPRFLQYSQIFSYRDHLSRFFYQVPREQRLTLIFEEFFDDPRTGYLQVLDFLGLDSDNRTRFEVVNSARAHRFRCLAAMHRRLVNTNGPTYRVLKLLMTNVGIHPSAILAKFNRKPAEKPEIRPAFKTELHAHFASDVQAVEHQLGRKIERWWL